MVFKINTLSVDLLSDQANVALYDQEAQSSIHINIRIETPGNQPENRLQEIAKAAAKKALQDAIDAL